MKQKQTNRQANKQIVTKNWKKVAAERVLIKLGSEVFQVLTQILHNQMIYTK